MKPLWPCRIDLALGLALALVAGCKKETQLAGVQKWNVNSTTLADATGKCFPEDLADGRAGMHCVGQRPMGIKGMAVDLDLIFAGTEPTAKLYEIQMFTRGCDEEKMFAWLQTNFGVPFEDRGSRKAWRNPFVYLVGDLPLEDAVAQCLVRIIPTREQARFDALWEERAPAPAPAAPAAPTAP